MYWMNPDILIHFVCLFSLIREDLLKNDFTVNMKLLQVGAKLIIHPLLAFNLIPDCLEVISLCILYYKNYSLWSCQNDNIML